MHDIENFKNVYPWILQDNKMVARSTQQTKEYALYVAGQAVQTGEWLEVKHKYNHELYARVALADANTLEQAIQSAVDAEAEMAALEPFQKQKILLHCVKRFNEIREELTEILIAEGGKPRKAAGAEVERLINTFQFAADAVTQMDQVTQQNASLVEEAAAATDQLASQADRLTGLVAVFNVKEHVEAVTEVGRSQAVPVVS